LNLASALIKQIIAQSDIETWGDVRKHYLPGEFQGLFTLIDKHVVTYRQLPSFDDLKLSIRDKVLQERVFSIESIEVDSDAYSLLEYLKNEYAQVLILDELDRYIETSIAMSSAGENVDALQEIISIVEDKVDLEDPTENLQTISLFEPKDILDKYVRLGLNNDFDANNTWRPTEYILVGGRKGSGKSVVCSNIANYTHLQGGSALYFTIEMPTIEILQRQCSIATETNLTRLEKRDLDKVEWMNVAKWWSNRFEDGEELLPNFAKNYDFDSFHGELIRRPIKRDNMIDIVYNSELSISKIRNTLDTRMINTDYNVVIVDYINQITVNSRDGQYDWKQQIEISKNLKKIALDYKVILVSAYQTDDSGATRFSKGILDAPNATYALNAYSHEDACMEFTCEKARGRPPMGFTSEVDWSCVKIGPNSALSPTAKQDLKDSMETGEDPDDISSGNPFYREN